MRKTTTYKGANVVYSHTGVGQVIVLLHGFLEDRSMWNQYTSQLSKEHCIICVDLLGQGESGNIGYVHSMEDQAKAVVSVLKAEQVEKFTVVGHSMGGYVGLALAEELPKMIQSLTLFHSTAYSDPEEKKLDRERVIDLVQRNKKIYINAAIPTLFAEHNRSALKTEISELIETADRFSDQGIIANLRGMKDRKDRSEILRVGKFKKLIIHGELDSVISSNDVQKLANLAEDISLKSIANIGHMGHLEAPETCLEIISEFCKS